jgi:hypothetical protein
VEGYLDDGAMGAVIWAIEGAGVVVAAAAAVVYRQFRDGNGSWLRDRRFFCLESRNRIRGGIARAMWSSLLSDSLIRTEVKAYESKHTGKINGKPSNWLQWLQTIFQSKVRKRFSLPNFCSSVSRSSRCVLSSGQLQRCRH